MTERFQACLDHVLEREGGFIDHPLDRGGPTNFGITLATLSAYRGVACTREDVKNLTLIEASKIYEIRYWKTMRLERILSWRVALILFDQGVHSGTFKPIVMLQEVLNESFGASLKVDGVFGDKTDYAILCATDSMLCRKLIQKAQSRYVSICQNNPSQLVFLNGWLNRTFSLWDAVL